MKLFVNYFPIISLDHQAPSITTDQITTNKQLNKQLLSDILCVTQSGGYGGKGIFISSFILVSGYTETEKISSIDRQLTLSNLFGIWYLLLLLLAMCVYF